MSDSVRELVSKPPRKRKAKVDDVIAKAPTGKRRGRPPGQYAAQLALQEMMYNHPDKERVINEVFRAALDQDHKNQAAAMKIVTDRLVPVSGFEKLRGSNAIQINISTVGEPSISGNVIEGGDLAEIEDDAD
jgi:hypothetical protein